MLVYNTQAAETGRCILYTVSIRMHALVFPYKPYIIIYLDADLIPGFYPIIRAQLRLFDLVIVTLTTYLLLTCSHYLVNVS